MPSRPRPARGTPTSVLRPLRLPGAPRGAGRGGVDSPGCRKQGAGACAFGGSGGEAPGGEALGAAVPCSSGPVSSARAGAARARASCPRALRASGPP